MIEKEKPKIQLKIAEDFLNLKTLDTSVIIKKLENSIKVREMKIEDHIKREMQKNI